MHGGAYCLLREKRNRQNFIIMPQLPEESGCAPSSLNDLSRTDVDVLMDHWWFSIAIGENKGGASEG